MKNLLIGALCLIALGSSAQTAKPGYVQKLENIFQSRQIHYELSFSDSIKFKHPYIIHGKTLGILTVNNSKYPKCTLKYYVYQYTNKDSIAHDVMEFYGLREDVQFGREPYEPVFYMDNYVFFNQGWNSGNDLVVADDEVKYMSIYIADEMNLYAKYDKDKY